MELFLCPFSFFQIVSSCVPPHILCFKIPMVEAMLQDCSQGEES